MTVTGSGMTLTLPGDRQILIERAFGAPRARVFRAWATPDLVRRWWAGRRGEMTVCEMDFRVGGRWRYAMVTHGGQEVAFSGEYREIVPDERIVWTEVFEAMPGEPALVTATFTEAGGRTTVALLSEYASEATRDIVAASGMETGVQEQFELIDELVG
jgi:uncharacterized protein YndB with AHSA1/START domain